MVTSGAVVEGSFEGPDGGVVCAIAGDGEKIGVRWTYGVRVVGRSGRGRGRGRAVCCLPITPNLQGFSGRL